MTKPQEKRQYSFAELREISAHFEIPGTIYMIYPIGSGHINDTFCIETHFNRRMKRYLLQRINTDIFKQPKELMDNIKLVTEKLQNGIKARGGDPLRECLTLVNTKNGLHYRFSPDGVFWRCFHFIEEACSYDYVNNDEQGRHRAYEAAFAFGEFQKLLSDLPGTSLHETIPFFHHTPERLRQLQDAIEINYGSRLVKCEKEFAFAREREHIAPILIGLLENGTIPLRPCHNDTKINNVMFDYTGETEKAKVIIDLDTLMPGTALYDFGDLVRTTTCPAAEDEKDLTRVIFEIDLFEQLVAGFLGGIGDLITDGEIKYLALSGKLITYNMGIRFLVDFLRGDTYYKIHREEHNLDRARTQFKLIEEMEKQWNEMEAIVKKYAK